MLLCKNIAGPALKYPHYDLAYNVGFLFLGVAFMSKYQSLKNGIQKFFFDDNICHLNDDQDLDIEKKYLWEALFFLGRPLAEKFTSDRLEEQVNPFRTTFTLYDLVGLLLLSFVNFKKVDIDHVDKIFVYEYWLINTMNILDCTEEIKEANATYNKERDEEDVNDFKNIISHMAVVCSLLCVI